MKNIVLISVLVISGLLTIKVIQADFSHKSDGQTLKHNQVHDGFNIWNLCKDNNLNT